MSVEKKLIGMCLGRSESFSLAKSLGVKREYFQDAFCAELWGHLDAADDDGQEPWIGTVGPKLDAASFDDATALMTSAPITQNIRYHVQCVKDEAWKRLVISEIRSLSRLASTHEPGTPMADIEQILIDRITALAEKADNARPNGVRYVKDILPSWVEDVEQRVTRELSNGVPTGFSESLDVMFNGGWHRGSIYALAARPGKGKTTFGVCAAISAARAGHGVYFATVEMSDLDIVTKVMSNVASVVGGKYMSGDLSHDELDRTTAAAMSISELPIRIDHQWRGDIGKLFAGVRSAKRKHDVSLIVVDYIGLCRLPGRWPSFREMMIEVSSSLKRFAIETNTAVLVLAQLNRDAEKTDLPGADNIAESDALARDADGVLCIGYEKMQDKTSEPRMFINVAKNRWGKQGPFPCRIDLAKNKIMEDV